MRGGAEFPQSTFPKGTVIIHEGDAGNAAYIIASGQCEVRKTINGVSSVLKTLGAGEVFGEMAALTESARTATVVATEDTTALVVTRAVMQQELDLMKPWIALTAPDYRRAFPLSLHDQARDAQRRAHSRAAETSPHAPLDVGHGGTQRRLYGCVVEARAL